jgi:hypothetical protein
VISEHRAVNTGIGFNVCRLGERIDPYKRRILKRVTIFFRDFSKVYAIITEGYV